MSSIGICSAEHPARQLTQRLIEGHGLRLVRFGVVGVFGVLINSVVLFALVEAGHLNHLIAAAIASEVSILTNFAINDRWTFADARSGCAWPVRAAQYNAVAMSGSVISLCVLAVLTMVFGMYYLVANLMAIAAATLSNYMLNTRFTWGKGAELVPVLAD
jgi:dolichol-phosphate mannosyltransferase